MRLEDSPAHSIGSFGLKGSVEYAEDIYVGYRYYDSKEVPVRFCFGHGLSYTSFEYDGLDVHEVGDAIRLRCQVANTGNVRGKAVAQVYLGLEGTGEDRPAKELKGYRKVELEAGERRELIIEIPVDQALRYYSSSQGRYAIAPRAKVYVGQSVEDIRLTGAID